MKAFDLRFSLSVNLVALGTSWRAVRLGQLVQLLPRQVEESLSRRTNLDDVIMAKIISTIKAILTRIIFSAHSLLAIWQVTTFKNDIIYWTLCGPLLLLLLEGIFTIMIKKTQEWRW